MIVIDNLMQEFYANKTEEFLLGPSVSWRYIKSVSGDADKSVFENDPNIKDTDAFVHNIIVDGESVSEFSPIIKEIVNSIELKTNKKIDQVIRARAVLIPKNSLEDINCYHLPHVDFEFPHMTAIYYVNDTDGDTVFFKETYQSNIEKKNIDMLVTPKKNRCVVFNGLQFHAGKTSKTNIRALININFFFS